MGYLNFGDTHPVEHGGFFIKEDEEVEDQLYVVMVDKYDDKEDTYRIINFVADKNDILEHAKKYEKENDTYFIESKPGDKDYVYDMLVELIGYYGPDLLSDPEIENITAEEEEIIKKLESEYELIINEDGEFVVNE